MRKLDIAEHIVSNTTLTKSQAIEAVDCVFDAIRKALVKGDSVYIRGFATFKAHTTKARKARLISAGKTIDLPARKTAKLVLSPELKSRMNDDGWND